MKKRINNNINSNQVIEQLDPDIIEKIKKLFSKIKKNDEFEFIFFGRKENYLSQEKYIQLLKFITKRSEYDKNLLITKPNDVLDIIYSDNDINYRCSIEGTETINKYMKKLSTHRNHVIFRTVVKFYNEKDIENITIIQKERKQDQTVDVDDFNMRVRLSAEDKPDKNTMFKLENLDETVKNKITFRYKQRTSLYVYGDPDNDFVRIDLTYTKTTKNYKNINISIPNYELEIECGIKKSIDTKMLDIMFKETEIITKIIQQSNFIISNSKQYEVIDYYKNLLSIKENPISLDARQSISLEVQYVPDVLPNKYAVTDKADGERYFGLIYNNEVYFISTNLNVKATGIKLSKKLSDYNGSLVDGELIFITEKNRHVYLIFDCLFHKLNDVRKTVKLFDRIKYADDIINQCFIFDGQTGFEIGKNKLNMKTFDLDIKIKYHVDEIKNMMKAFNNDIEKEKLYPLIRRKYFIGAEGAKEWEIFSYSVLLWNAYTNTSDIHCPYFLDGLIYQPLEQAYITSRNESRLQDYKWKPPEKNSIDFYVEFEKDANDNIVTVYDNSYDDFIRNKPYRICKLYVGRVTNKVETPVYFKDNENLHLSYLFLDNGEIRDIDGNMISDKTVVEFYYNNDPTLLHNFRWTPMRTRYDKTESILRHGKKYGNYYTVANTVWRSINNPVLMSDFDDLSRGNDPDKNIYTYDKKMDSLRKRIDEQLIITATKANAYFQLQTDLAKPMRNFHNFIKSNIIYTMVNPTYQDNKQQSVLDFACGRGADINKFYYAAVAFYVGLDIDREGLVDPLNGAISRYNKQRKSKAKFPKMYFMQADTTTEFDLESQKKALGNRKLVNEEYFNKFFSTNPKNRTLFDVINCQFAIHYMLKNEESWSNFKKNINNYLRNGGFFLTTSFDSDKVRKLLGDKDKYTQDYINRDGETKTLFEIIKKYDDTDENTIMGTGNAIDVYLAWFSQEGRYLTEYLVDSKFLIPELLKDCNLELIDTDSFKNQLIIQNDYLNIFSNYEEVDETRKFLKNVSDFYKSNNINDGCKQFNSLMRYYIFRKKDNNIQSGGDLTDFSNPNLFNIPEMNNKKYDNEYSFINSIHHILKHNGIIPKYISVKKMCNDLDIDYMNDLDINPVEIGKSIIITHIVDKNKKQIEEKILNGLNIFIIERDCDNNYDITLYKKGKTINKLDDNIIIMKEGSLYVPVYYIENDNTYSGLFDKTHDVIKRLLEEV